MYSVLHCQPATRRRIVRFLPVVLLASLASIAHGQWTAPTQEELTMTSQPEVPGASAVYLFKEETTEDKLHMWSIYVRLKVLTEAGKEFANVELKQYSSTEYGGFTIGDIEGRTIHPDGTIIPFTGKPFEKMIEKEQGFKAKEKVFTLPDVTVGSILEYRYKLRYDDNMFMHPNWFVQSELYTRKAHYSWKPTGETLVSHDEGGEQLTNGIAWTPILPKDVEIKQTHTASAGVGGSGSQLMMELNVHDIPPMPKEQYMPPIDSFSYRVLFYYTPYRTGDEFWKNRGKHWAKARDKFIGPGSKVTEAVKGIVSASDTQDQKLRKIYAAVMKLENTSYSRDRSVAEDKSQGLGVAKTTDDVWERKRGTDDQIAQLFVAMARAAGMKAYLMAVTNRNRSFFLPSYLSTDQLDDDIAIVNVDGKEQFFDPGQRYCPYQLLAWKHTIVQGLRQTEAGAAFSGTPDQSYKEARTDRIADLTLDEHGEAAGTVTMTYRGAPALHWRQISLRGDEEKLRHDLRTRLEELLPGGMEVKVKSIQNIEEYEQPLIATFDVKGQVATSTGKRLLLPSDIFEVNAKPPFSQEKRELAVYFDYRQSVLDAVRFKFPASLGVESVPSTEQIPLMMPAASSGSAAPATTAVYSIKTDTTPTSVTVHRNFTLGDLIFTPVQYPTLRTFYNKFETKDQEPVVLKVAAQVAASN